MSTKHDRIFQELRQKILAGDLQPGEALPTHNTLMEQYSAALGTIRQAIDRLQNEGLVWSRRGKGTFVAEPTTNAPAVYKTCGLAIFSQHDSNPLADDILVTIQQTLQPSDYNLVFRVFGPDQSDQAHPWCEQLDGLLIYGQAPTHFIERRIDQQQPAVVLGELVDGDCPSGASQIAYDQEGVMSMAIQFLTNLGHKNIWFVNRYPDLESHYIDKLSTLFSRWMGHWAIDGHGQELTLAETGPMPSLIEQLDAAETPPTALLVENAFRAASVISTLVANGRNVPEDISVLTLSACSTALRLDPGLSRIEMPTRALATRATQILLDTIDSQRVVQQSLAPEFIWGQTCRPLVATPSTANTSQP